MKSLPNIALRIGLAYEAVKQSFTASKAAPLKVADTLVDSTNFFEVYGNSVLFKYYNTADKTLEAYKECAPLNYIINQKALQISTGKLIVEKIMGNGKRIPATDKRFEQLLKYPNPLETGSQFVARVNVILKLFRFCPVLMVKSAGFETDGPTQLWILPPHKCEIKTYKNRPFPSSIADRIEKFEIIGDDGKRAPINPEDVYWFTALDVTVGDDLIPDTVLESCRYQINNLIKNYESRGVITERRGALGIIAPEGADSAGPVRATPEQKEQLQKDYRKYGLTKDQWQIIISTIPLKFTPMSMNIRDLMLLELAEDDIKTLCGALGFKFNLTPWGSETAFANQNIGEKAQYQDFTIPEAENIMFQLTDCIGADEVNHVCRLDFSHVACLQEDEKQKSEVRRNNVTSVRLQFVSGLINYGRAMELLGESGSTLSELKDLFIWQLPEEIQAIYKIAQPADNNSNQNNSNNQ